MKRASKDGTVIAFDQVGEGPPIILVDAALCYRGVGPNSGLAERLAHNFSVLTYDRRGRGESGDTAPYAVDRELEDIVELIDAAGGSAHLYGISSGGALALEVAQRYPGKVPKLALYEIPFVVDDTRPPVRSDFARDLRGLIAKDRRGAAIRLFMKEAARLPSILVAVMPLFPGWSKNKRVAHTLPYDVAVMGDGQRGAPIPPGRWPAVTMPTLVLSGGKSPAWLRHAATQLTERLPNAQHRTLDGQTHYVKPDAIAPVLAQHFGA